MKKLAILVTAFILSLSLCACGCDNNTPATTTSTDGSTDNNSIMPTSTMTIPVPDTNIPDPSVDNSTPGGMTGSTDATGNQSRSGLNADRMG